MNTMILANLDGLVEIIILGFMFAWGIPIILFIIGVVRKNRKKKSGEALIVISLVWLIVSSGICLSLVA